MSEDLLDDDVVEVDGRYSMIDLIENGDDRDVKMILGNRDRIRPAGKIRPGIKIPVGTCTATQKALYDKLMLDNIGFETIDAEMLKLEAKGSPRKSCLRPSNCDYFLIRDADFNRTSDAELIRSRYADSDGKVRRIPVWFAMSERHRAIPHAFTAFDGGGNLRCVSFYDGDKMKFRYLPKGLQNAKTEDWKILDSEDEDEATKACGLKVSLTGAYHIQIPGIRSVGGVLVNTKSWYGLSDAMAVLKEVRRVLGRFDGLFQGNPFFELVKVQQTMKVDGKPTKQWIVTLELAVDLMELARYAEPQQITARAQNAMRLLSGGTATGSASTQIKSTSAADEKHLSPSVTEDDLPDGLTDKKEDHQAASDIKTAMEEIDKLISPHGLLKADMELLYPQIYRGEVLEEASIERLRDFYHKVNFQLKNRTENFVLDLKSQRS